MYYDEEAEKEFSPEVEKEIEDILNLEKEELYTKCNLFVIRLLIAFLLSHQLPFSHYPQKSVPPAGGEQPVEKHDACR